MRYQLQLFLTAVMFFTRLPIPIKLPYSSTMLQKSARYFSWVGVMVGVMAAYSFYLLQFVFSIPLAIAGSMLATILTTGAFHEDGFADCCDAFGGGYTKEKILTIMKDSRLGTYGVIGVVGILAFKLLLLLQLHTQIPLYYFLWIMVVAHAYSRFMAVLIMQWLPYVQDIDASKIKPLANKPLAWYELVIAAIAAFVGFCFLPISFLLSTIVLLLVTILCTAYFKKYIGGYTGDCLGATQQITELSFYIAVVLINTYLP
jgi:adenosylcobinamide-GDP ribazoletransferase